MAATLTWYYQAETGVVGPVSSAELKRLIDRGVVRSTTRIRRGEEGSWIPAEGIQAVLGPEGGGGADPAARGDAAEWYVSLAGKRKLGPLTRAVVDSMLTQGKLRPTDPVWKDGMAAWVPATEVPGLVPAAAAAPSLFVDATRPELPVADVMDEVGDIPVVVEEETLTRLYPRPAAPGVGARPVVLGLSLSDKRLLAGGIGAGVVLIASISALGWSLLNRRGARPTATVERAPDARGTPTRTLADRNPTRTDPKKAPATANAEHLYDAAVDAVQAGRPVVARPLLDKYLASPEIERSDPARALLREINLAMSIADARRMAAGLSDEELQESLRIGFEERAAARIATPELRIVYVRTLTQAFRQETNQRRSRQKKGAPMTKKSGPSGRPKSVEITPAPAPVAPVGNLAAGAGGAEEPANPAAPKDLGLAGGPPLPGDGALDNILAAPAKFAGRATVVDGFYKIGTRVSEVKGPDGRPVGWSLPIARNDGGVICSGEAKVVGRDVYLILEDGLAPFLKGIFQTLKMQTTLKPVHKCILTVRVARRGNLPVVEITGMEILGICDLSKLINNQYDKAFTTVRIARGKADVGYGDGTMWVERLGGEEYIIRLRKRVRDLQRRMIADQNQALVGRFLAAEMGRIMTINAAAQAQQARALSGLIGRPVLPGGP